MSEKRQETAKTESGARFTPSPWAIGGTHGNHSEEILSLDGYPIAAVRTRGDMNARGDFAPFTIEGRANLCLILSAPDLMHALELALAKDPCWEPYARAVLREAGGQRMKTREQWRTVDMNLSEFLHVGDPVDDELYEYMRDVLPPACHSSRCLQMGEAYSHDERGRPTFLTLANGGDGWYYAGTIPTPKGEVQSYS
jgi:hypothetical protein